MAGWTDADREFMREAIKLSERGFPAPNPRVGAVIVKEGRVVGRGHHEAAGLPHAEAVALAQAASAAKGADLYVTLEPCLHQGRTPPCAQAIIEAGIQRALFAIADPNPQAAGGAERLRQAGVEAECGLLAAEAAAVNRVFLERHRLGRPWVLIKAAVALDGRIATESGESRWITGPEARKRAHELRAEMGCVLVGSGTARADNPSLTVREVEAQSRPLRVVLDPDACLEPHLRVFTDALAPTLWVTGRKVTVPVREFVQTFVCPMAPRPAAAQGGAEAGPAVSEFELSRLLAHLADLGMIGVLVEGGGLTAESFLRQGCADAVELHVAPTVFGSGRAWADGPGVVRLADAWRLSGLRAEPLGDGLRVWGEVER